MPFLPPAQFGRAKKRMQQGLHPAVLAALDRAVNGTPLQQAPVAALTAPRAGASRQISAGGGTSARGDYRSYLQQDPGGDVRELHVYNNNGKRQVMAFHPASVSAAQQARLAPSPKQHLSNSATAEDKLLAMAARRAAMSELPSANVGTKRRFTRTPGMLRRY